MPTHPISIISITSTPVHKRSQAAYCQSSPGNVPGWFSFALLQSREAWEKCSFQAPSPHAASMPHPYLRETAGPGLAVCLSLLGGECGESVWVHTSGACPFEALPLWVLIPKLESSSFFSLMFPNSIHPGRIFFFLSLFEQLTTLSSLCPAPVFSRFREREAGSLG